MKKILTLLIALPVLFMTGCSSNKVDFTPYKTGAIFSVRSNSALPWYVSKGASETDGKKENTGEGILTQALHNMTGNIDPEFNTAQERLDDAEAAFHDIMTEIAGIQILDKDTVVNSKKYKMIGGGVLKILQSSTAASDYHNLSQISKFNCREVLKEVNADCGFILSFQFNKKVMQGNRTYGEIAPYGELKVTMLDRQGNKIAEKKYAADGAERIKVRGRSYDHAELVDLYGELSKTLISMFAVDWVSSN
jgi:hypothetical protein